MANLKPFTVQAQACPLRQAWRGTQFEGGKGLTLRPFGDKPQNPGRNRYTVQAQGQTLGLLLGPAWTSGQAAAFVPGGALDADQVRALGLPLGTKEAFNFDQEIRLETEQELKWFLSDLASTGLAKALENYYEGYNL